MFLRHKVRRKDGKQHRYWSIVENRRVSGGRTMQRHVLYLGEINDAQRAAWCQTIQGCSMLSTEAPVGQGIESSESGGVSVLTEGAGSVTA